MISLASLAEHGVSSESCIPMLCCWNLHAQECDLEVGFSVYVGTCLVFQMSEIECGHTIFYYSAVF